MKDGKKTARQILTEQASSAKPSVLRINVTLDPDSVSDFEEIQNMSLLSGPVDVVRRALTVLSDMLWAQRKGYEIVLRRRDGAEWSYSPHLPQRAIAIVKESPVKAPATAGD